MKKENLTPPSKSYYIDSRTIDISKFEEKMRGILGKIGEKIWISDDVKDIISRVTVDGSVVSLDGYDFFSHKFEENICFPFMPNSVFDLCLKRGRREARHYLAKFFLFFEIKHNTDAFPRDAKFIFFPPYMRRWSKKGEEKISIKMYFEPDDNTWNISSNHGLLWETDAGNVYFSDKTIANYGEVITYSEMDIRHQIITSSIRNKYRKIFKKAF